MNLIEQCQQWNEQDEFQKIIDAIEAIPADQRTPELDSELARAYNNLAEPTDRHLFQKSLALLKPHENYFKGDHCWNFRIAYAYYYLEQEGRALHYFRQALDARPGDEDTRQMIEACRKDLSLPRFNKTFRERTEKAWAAFEREEARLRKIMREDIRHERSKELISRCERVLSIALSDTAFELGCQKDRYELVLSPEGERMKLFPLVYFQQHAPASVRKNWDIIVGRQKNPHSTIRIDEYEVKGKDVDVWIEQIKGKQVVLTLYCEKLLPLLKENENKAWWMVANLMSHELGEIAYLSLIRSFELTATPKKGIPCLHFLQCLTVCGWDLESPADKEGNTALSVACRGAKYDTGIWAVRYLVENGADVNAHNMQGQTPAMNLYGGRYWDGNIPRFSGFARSYPYDGRACTEQDAETLEVLLEAGADINVKDKWGNTLLHYIAGSSMRGSKEATELVMEFGTPDVSAVNNEGLTALDIAAKKNDETLVKFLLKYS